MAERRRDAIRNYCSERGLAVVPYGPNAWWITGAGVSVITCDLAGVAVSQLEPKPITDR